MLTLTGCHCLSTMCPTNILSQNPHSGLNNLTFPSLSLDAGLAIAVPWVGLIFLYVFSFYFYFLDFRVSLPHFLTFLFLFWMSGWRPLGGATWGLRGAAWLARTWPDTTGNTGWHSPLPSAKGTKTEFRFISICAPITNLTTLPALMNRLQGPGKAPILGVRLIIHKWWSQDKHKEFNQGRWSGEKSEVELMASK